jgi:NAD-dependent deacetylase
MDKKKIVILTGAGISAESGLKTFRDAQGLWEGHDVMEVASPQGFARNPQLVLEFYNQRRRQLQKVAPNAGHRALVRLEGHAQVQIVTQNVDNLHERAGSTQVIHLHGELLKARSTVDEKYVVPWQRDLVLGDLDPNGHQLRPHIVWFGERVPLMDLAQGITQGADRLIIVGTSMQVYPAANLIHCVSPGTPIHFIDPRPQPRASDFPGIDLIPQTAVRALPPLVDRILEGL